MPVCRNITLAFTACLFSFTSATAETTYQMENRTALLNYTITGPGKAQSFYDPKARIYHESDIQISDLQLGGDWKGSLLTTLRYTDSPQYDPNYTSIQNLAIHLADPQNNIDAGDVFANLSPYSMMKGIKGVGFQHNFGDDRNYVRAVYGSFDGQWAYLLLNSRLDEPMDRFGGGVRVQRAIDNLTVGANLAQVADRARDPKRGTSNVYRQVLPAVDWEYRSGGMVLSGEHAYSRSKLLPYASLSQSLQGYANRIVFRGIYRTFSLNGNVERVTPNFITLGGGATPDRMRYHARADWRLDRQWQIFSDYDQFYNSLSQQLSTRTHYETAEAGIIRRHLLGRRASALTISGRSRSKRTDDGSASARSHRIRLKYKDRAFDNALNYTLDYERLLNTDKAGIATTRLSNNLYHISVGYRGYDIGKWRVSGDFDFGRQELQNPTTANFDISDMMLLSLKAKSSGGSELGASYNLGSNRVTVAGSGSRQNRGMVYFSIAPKILHGGSIRSEYSLNDYRFDNVTRNYREGLLQVLINWNLKK
ncbi:hypothetical protein AL013_12845 [Mariprofundus ferrooxydans]|nr:hypothetical protein AL013_12845 [Mariprofundus ferrooxydans]